ncbi:hypothetical protein D3C72_1900680 [compost metagenome]
MLKVGEGLIESRLAQFLVERPILQNSDGPVHEALLTVVRNVEEACQQRQDKGLGVVFTKVRFAIGGDSLRQVMCEALRVGLNRCDAGGREVGLEQVTVDLVIRRVAGQRWQHKARTFRRYLARNFRCAR